jgi:hypothetical protein
MGVPLGKVLVLRPKEEVPCVLGKMSVRVSPFFRNIVSPSSPSPCQPAQSSWRECNTGVTTAIPVNGMSTRVNGM